MPKIVFWHHCYLALRSRSKVGVKVKGRVKGRGHTSGVQRSILGTLSLPVQGVCLCVCNQLAFADYCEDAVDLLLILSGE